MKLSSPFSSKEEVIPLIEAGANELYCGIVPNEYSKKYSYTLNRRHGYGANFDSFEELEKSLIIAHRKNVKVYITLNCFYVQEQYPLILKIIKKLIDIDVDGFVLADIGLLFLLRERGIKKDICMGTLGTVFNSKAVSFYYKLGVSRIILSRHLTINEIEVIASNSNKTELGVFILYEPCHYVDGFCTLHAPDTSKKIGQAVVAKNKNVSFISSHLAFNGSGCSLVDSPRFIFNDKTGKEIKINEKSFPPVISNNLICGACAIYDFNKIGISSLKIAGRGMPIDLKIKGTRFIREALNIVKKKDISKEHFIKEIQQLHGKIYGMMKCSGFNCYYPSVFSQKNNLKMR